MKICILTSDINKKAGWGRYSDVLISELRRQGHTVTVLTEQGGDHPILQRRLGILIASIRAIPFFYQSDIIHALDVYPFGIIGWIGNLFLQKPFVLTAQGAYSVAPLKKQFSGWIARYVCKTADAVIAISRYTADRVKTHVPEAKITIIHHGIDVQQYYPLVDRKEPPLRLISVGGLKKRKGYHVSLHAFALAREQIPGLRYTIVGNDRDTTYVRELRNMIESLGISDSITFLHDLSEDELKQEYGKAGLFILTSVNDRNHFEGFGLVFLEAAAMGLPVIGTFDNGITDAVRDGNNAILVPQNDPKSTSDAIWAILSDFGKWKRMSIASRYWAEKNDIDTFTENYDQVYRSLLK